MNRIKRINLINSITGIKPANLVGTVSEKHGTNLAIFSSVVHLGSNPAYIGLVTRPTTEVPRHTYLNIKENGYYTVNHIPIHLVEQAHYTSAKLEQGVSEFDICGFTASYIEDFPAPFVAESSIKMGLRLVDEIPIPINGTILLVGAIEHLIVPENCLDNNYLVDLASIQTAGIGGLNAYYRLEKTAEFPYARPSEIPTFKH